MNESNRTDSERMTYLERRAKVVRRNGEGWLVLGHELGDMAYKATLRDTVDTILDGRAKREAVAAAAPCGITTKGA